MSTTAAELNAAIRAEIVEMWTCLGRPHFAESAKTSGLVEAVGLIFAEVAHSDDLARMEGLQKRVRDLERELKAGSAPYEQQIAALNKRIIQMNEEALKREITGAQQ